MFSKLLPLVVSTLLLCSQLTLGSPLAPDSDSPDGNLTAMDTSFPSRYGERCTGRYDINPKGTYVGAWFRCSGIPGGVSIMGMFSTRTRSAVTDKFSVNDIDFYVEAPNNDDGPSLSIWYYLRLDGTEGDCQHEMVLLPGTIRHYAVRMTCYSISRAVQVQGTLDIKIWKDKHTAWVAGPISRTVVETSDYSDDGNRGTRLDWKLK